MLPELRPASLPFQTRFFYGWIIVFVSAMGIFFSGPGQTYSVSVFVDPLIEHFNDLGLLYHGAPVVLHHARPGAPWAAP